MRMRTVVGLAGATVYVALVAHASVGARCPARQLGPCAQVHAMLTRARPVTPIAALPMTARTDGVRLALLASPR